jgi:NTE family protein
MPYEEEDADFFFGRTREVRLVIANLFAAPATVLLGPSGVGKSSILRAGVVSQLRGRSDILPVVYSSWREDPVAELRRVVSRAVEQSSSPGRSHPVNSSRTLAEDIRFQAKRANRHLVIILDQFEEFFLYHSSNHPFLDELAGAVNSSALNPRGAEASAALSIDSSRRTDASSYDTDVSRLAVRARIGRVLYGLTDNQRPLAVMVLRDLVSASGARSLRSISDLISRTGSSQGLVEALCRQLESAGLLHSESNRSGHAPTTYYQLTHDLAAAAIQDSISRDSPDAIIDEWLTSPAPAATSYLLSLREDALATLDQFEGRIPDLMERLLRVENLDRTGGREAITLPLRVYSERQMPDAAIVSIEPALVETVLDQVAGGRIIVSEYAMGTRRIDPGSEGAERIEAAFLQLVMTRLWDEERRRGSSMLRVATLHDLHGAEHIVRTHLDQVMEQFAIEEKQLASRVLRYLITPSGAKITHSASDLADYAQADRRDVDRLLTRLSGGSDRILRPVAATPERPDAPRYEIFHDRLGQAILGWLERFGSQEAARQATGAASSPVSNVTVYEDAPDEAPVIEDGAALCLAGAGYRGMLFHLGALWRLNELGLLTKLGRVSAVSSGSFVAATLGFAWRRLEFDAAGVGRSFLEAVVTPLRNLASQTIDARSIVQGALLPGASASERFANNLDRLLFHGATLQDLPDQPRFVLVASNMQNGAVWRFSKPYVGDYRFGLVRWPELPLATAAASSAATPPVLSPMRLNVDREAIDSAEHSDSPSGDRTEVFLTDGSVLDRLAIETAWKRYSNVLVSDGSGKLAVHQEPPTDWRRQSVRVLELMDWQARSAQKRQLIESFRSGVRKGTYWGIASSVQDYMLPDALPCPVERTRELAEVPTRFKELDTRLQERLINWGYAVCDTAVRRHYFLSAPPSPGFPYPSTAV